MPRLFSLLLVGLILGGTLLSTSATLRRPGIAPGTLCLATGFPAMREDSFERAWGRSLAHAVELAVQQHYTLGNGYTLEAIPFNEASTTV